MVANVLSSAANLVTQDGAVSGKPISNSTPSMAGFTAKLDRRTPSLSGAHDALLSLPTSIVQAEAQDIIIEEDAESRRCLFVASGFVSRQKRANGTRRIVALGIPGDAVDMQSLWFDHQDHSVVTHSRTTLIAIEHADIIELCERSPHVAKALWKDTLVDAAIFREWTLNVGHRRATARIAHLLLETATRLRAHGLIQEDAFELPLTQSELASALGLSLVHMNKSLKALRNEGHIQIQGRLITLLDRRSLEQATGFNAGYLHVAPTPRSNGAELAGTR